MAGWGKAGAEVTLSRSARRPIASLLLVGSLGLVCSPGASEERESPPDMELASIVLQNRTVQPTPGVEPAVREALAERGAGDRGLPVLLTLRRPPMAADREALERRGITLEAWLGHTSYRATVQAGEGMLEAGSGDPLVMWAGAIAPEDRMARDVWQKDPPDWASMKQGLWLIEVALRDGIGEEEARSLLAEHAVTLTRQSNPSGHAAWAIEIAPKNVAKLAGDERVERLEFGPDPMMPLLKE